MVGEVNRKQRRHDRRVAAVAFFFASLPFVILALLILLKGYAS